MTIWTINDHTLSGFTEKRDIAIPWFRANENIYGRKALVKNTVRDAKPFRLAMKLRGSGRYDEETSIRAELESDTVLIEATNKNIYKNKKTCWVVPTGFNVKDSDRTLVCELAGFIDERTLHSCDFATDWTGNSVSVSTDTRFSTGSIKDASISSGNTTRFTPTEAINLNSHSYISIWHKQSQAVTASLRLFTNSDYNAWTLTSSTAWSHQTFELASPDTTNGSPSLTNITSMGVYTTGSGSWDLYIGWVYAE